MKINFKKLFISIFITFAFGLLFSFFIHDFDTSNISIIPSYVFPIVWTILYFLMGISFYIITESTSQSKEKAIIFYILQLIFNSLWTLFFFGLKLYTFSFVWIILLIILVVLMITEFYKINKVAAYLNIPYFIWLLIASKILFNFLV
ncbi:MAG: TspO/MBR family protein [Bacilli bacterium]